MRIIVGSLAQMRALAKVLAGQLHAGDLLILTGKLGAGKTTFTQSLGAALDVSGRITSPTFIIAREHPSRAGGPALVHVDAYRLADGEELEDLDLAPERAGSVTGSAWGAAVAGQPSGRCPAATPAAALPAEDDQVDGEDERRIGDLTGHGPAWEVRLPQVRAATAAGEG